MEFSEKLLTIFYTAAIAQTGIAAFNTEYSLINNSESEITVQNEWRLILMSDIKKKTIAPNTILTTKISGPTEKRISLLSFENSNNTPCSSTNFTLPFKLESDTAYTFTIKGTADTCSVSLSY